jgi:hypothetical protein
MTPQREREVSLIRIPLPEKLKRTQEMVDRALIVAAIVGLNMDQTGFTGWCPMALTLRKLGVKSESVFV